MCISDNIATCIYRQNEYGTFCAAIIAYFRVCSGVFCTWSLLAFLILAIMQCGKCIPVRPKDLLSICQSFSLKAMSSTRPGEVKYHESILQIESNVTNKKCHYNVNGVMV